jgi:hypothetical protein
VREERGRIRWSKGVREREEDKKGRDKRDRERDKRDNLDEEGQEGMRGEGTRDEGEKAK